MPNQMKEIHLLTLTILSAVINTNFTNTQLADNLYFAPNTPQVRTVANLGTIETSSQYTLWGWYKFNGETPAISNIVSLRNIKYVEAKDQDLEFIHNPKHPKCPVSQTKLAQDPSLLTQSGIMDNPNCFPTKVDHKDTGLPKQQRMAEDLLYINYDLNPKQGNRQDFSIIFLVQSGIANTGNSDMKIEGFTDLPAIKDTWSFFAISADYQGGEISIYFNMYDVEITPKFKTFAIDYPGFALRENAEIVIAGVELNPYFQSTSGFIGNIALIEMGLFYTTNLEAIWAIHLSKLSYTFDGIIIELVFDIFTNDKTLTSRGMLELDYKLEGNFMAVHSSDRSRLGLIADRSTSIDLGSIDFNNSEDLVKSFCFYFHIKFDADLPQEFILLTRGIESKSGYMRISLVKKNNGRVVQLNVNKSTQNISWQSSRVFEPEREVYFIIGISLSPANSLRVIYWDDSGELNYNQLATTVNFDDSPLNMTLLNNPDDTKDKGRFILYRFMVLNSASSVLYNSIIVNNVDPKVAELQNDCKLYTSSYEEAFGCFICKSNISDIDRQCANYCPYGFINAFSKTCVKCRTPKCESFNTTKWSVERRDKNIFRLRPSRKILSDIDFDNLFVIKVHETDEIIPYIQSVNPDEQYVDITLLIDKNINNKRLDFILMKDPDNPDYDVNFNLIYQEKIPVPIERICVVSDGKRRTLRALAITILALYGLSLIFLIIFTICCFKKITDIGGFWKFFLHNWMKLQLVAFFLLLALNMPCCVKEFLNVLYLIVVRWNHAFNDIINRSQSGNQNFVEGIARKTPPENFEEVGVHAFILHNICVSFIVHLFILLVYIVLKIWDWLITSSSRFMYKTFVFMEFTVLIIGYLLVEMHIFVFSALNFRLALFTTAYFVISFIIAMAYIFVFFLFWIFALVRLAGPQSYFMNPVNYNRFYYFFSGYRNNRGSRTFDLWLLLGYFVVGLMIGLLLYSGLAQMIVILVVLVVIFALTLLLRPWFSVFLLIIDLISQLFIIAAVVVLLIIASYDASGCFDCGDREGSLCWLIVAFLFIGLALIALGLILALILALCLGDKFIHLGRQKKVIVMEENEYIDIHNPREHNHANVHPNNFYTSRFDVNPNEGYKAENYGYRNMEVPENYMRNDNIVYAGVLADKNYESIINKNDNIGLTEEVAHRSYSKDIYGLGNIDSRASNKESKVQEGNKKTMNEFLREIKQDRIREEDTELSYYSDSNYSNEIGERNFSKSNARSSRYHKDDPHVPTQMVRPDDIDEEFRQPQILRALSDNLQESDTDPSDREIPYNKGIVNMKKDQFYNRSHDDMYKDSTKFNVSSNYYGKGHEKDFGSSFKNDSWHSDGDSQPLKIKSKHYGTDSYFRSKRH